MHIYTCTNIHLHIHEQVKTVKQVRDLLSSAILAFTGRQETQLDYDMVKKWIDLQVAVREDRSALAATGDAPSTSL